MNELSIIYVILTCRPNGVARNKSLLSLNISKNLPKIKARDVVHVMEAIVQLIQVCDVPENMSAR